MSTLASSSAGDQSLEGVGFTPVGGKFEESQESLAHPVKKGSKGAAGEEGGPGAGGAGAAGGIAGANEGGLGGARGGGGGLNERCKDIMRPSTASSGVEYPSAQFQP